MSMELSPSSDDSKKEKGEKCRLTMVHKTQVGGTGGEKWMQISDEMGENKDSWWIDDICQCSQEFGHQASPKERRSMAWQKLSPMMHWMPCPFLKSDPPVKTRLTGWTNRDTSHYCSTPALPSRMWYSTHAGLLRLCCVDLL